MRTDKQLWQIFGVRPDWMYLLAGEPDPGPCEMRSQAVKALERTMDGLAVPEDPAVALLVGEFQFDLDPAIYPRVAQEMAAVQIEQQMQREVRGVIFFRLPRFDPQTAPWNQIIRAVHLGPALEQLESEQPDHPLVAVFKPVLQGDEQTLREQAVEHYRTIKNNEQLDDRAKELLEEVFIDWLCQRFQNFTREEMRAMLLGELPPLENTVVGKELIQIGEKRGWDAGKKEGVKEGVLEVLRRQISALSFAPFPQPFQDRIEALPSQKLIQLSLHVNNLQTLADWERYIEELE